MKKTFVFSILLFKVIISFGQIDQKLLDARSTFDRDRNDIDRGRNAFRQYEPEEKYKDRPTYYTTKEIPLYDEGFDESAIITDIPRGEAVKITGSYGTDMWEVFYLGERKTGWVKKAYLTRKEPIEKRQEEGNNNNILSKQVEGGTIYYTKQQILLYDSPDARSIITDVPHGAIVKATGAYNYKNNGVLWLEVFHSENKKTGWVEKSYLTSAKLETKQENNNTSSQNSSDDSADVGFDPFLAKVISSANFRAAPSTNSNIIRQLPVGTQLYVFSNQDVNGFYKVIDIKTGKIGWISKGLVKWTESVSINYSGAFQSTGKTSEYNSKVLIRNKSSYKITLVVGGKTFYLEPYSTETTYITPNRMYYIATAPGVNPTSGYQTFSSYESYEWTFWVETRSY